MKNRRSSDEFGCRQLRYSSLAIFSRIRTVDNKNRQCENYIMSKKGRQQGKSQGRAKPTTSNDRRRQNRAAQDKLIGPRRHWTASDTADRHTLNLVAECIADIAEAITQTNLSLQADKLTTASFQRACRRISVPIRKLILSGDTQLLRQCFVPILHPMSKPTSTVSTDKLTQWAGSQSITVGTAGSLDTDEFTFATEHTTETLVNPLYGLARTGELLYRLEELVDWSVAPIRYGPWLNTKVLQIDATVITAEDLLNMMVNREAAHTELNEMARVNAGGPIDIKIGDRAAEKYRKANVINFSGISYIQIFTFLFGHYLAKMMKSTLSQIPEELTGPKVTSDVWRIIMDTPERLAQFELRLDRQYAMGAVYETTGDSDNPLQLVGNYEDPSQTLVQIPGW